MPLYRSGSSIGGAIVGGTAGRIVYEAAGPVLADSANLLFTAAGAISSPGAGSESEHFGLAATAAGSRACTYGNAASSAGNQCIVMGYGANAAGANSVALGYGSAGGSTNNVCVGHGTAAGTVSTYNVVVGQAAAVANTALGCIALGAGTAITNQTGSIAIGRAATTAASNQLAIGSTTYPITTAYIGYGVSVTSNLSPGTFLLTTTAGASGSSDVPGNSIIIAGGAGTGTGVGGYIKFQTATAAAGTATTVNALVDRLLLDQLGNVVLAPSGSALSTSATTGFTYIPTCAGTAAGTPALTQTGAAPMVFDTAANKLWIYNPTGTPAWKYAAFS